MIRYALIYGAIAGTIVISVISAGIALDQPNHTTSEWFGYLVMLLALSLIFVGVKRFRDVECGGVIRFGRALGLGLAIALVAALIYIVGWEIYIATSDRDFIAEYGRSVVADLRAEGATQAKIDATAAQMRELSIKYRDPLFRIPITFVEIFPVGLLMALISAGLLRNPRVLPARVAA